MLHIIFDLFIRRQFVCGGSHDTVAEWDLYSGVIL